MSLLPSLQCCEVFHGRFQDTDKSPRRGRRLRVVKGATNWNSNSWKTVNPQRGTMTMTYRDPYNDRDTNSAPYGVYDREPRIVRMRDDGLSAGSIIGAFIGIAVVSAAMVYAINRSIIATAGG